MTILVYRWRNANTTTSTGSSEISSEPPSTKEARDGNASSPSSESSPTSSTFSTTPTMTPTFRTPQRNPDRSVSLTWTFETADTAARWGELMRDMVPMALHRWEGLPLWTTKHAVLVRVNSRTRLFQVRLTLWPEPQSDVAL